MKKLALLLLIGALIGLYFCFDLGRFVTIEVLEALVQQNPSQAIALYFVVYVLLCSLNFPGTGPLSIVSGMIFGFSTGVVLVSFAGAIGGTLSMLLARTLLRDWMQVRCSSFLEKVNKGLEGNAALYLFTIRMIPLIPVFVVNPVFGLTRMRVSVFYIVSQLGMLPITILYVNMGTSLGSIAALSLSTLFTPKVIVSFILMIIFPYGLQALLEKLKSWQAVRGEN